ncbi:hypothetical protein NliqN6_4439 [Naganishia liquefaciens]|uniref:Uncharacterized protein n=1 Tax=Naganishia liquefaciens TaxID=104408 RepID=A0A8H3TVS4_9TREE|nr:hypothetical protein NliqN6_4439 [Naganishia liquefaciens]
MPRPPSPPGDRRWTPRYSRERDRPRSYRDYDDRDRDYDDRDREYDRRDRERDEYRPPPLPRGGTYRGRRDYGSPPPMGRGRDRSWERERDYREREREREYDRDRDRERDRDLPRNRTRSPSPRGSRRYSPPPERYVRRPEYPPRYERPRRESTPRREVEEKAEAKKEVETGEYSEEEGMVTPPQGKKRKLEPEVEPPTEPVDTRKPQLVVSEPKKRILESPPHQSKARLAETAHPLVVPAQESSIAAVNVPVIDTPAANSPFAEALAVDAAASIDQSRSPIKISLPSMSLSSKLKPNTPILPAGPAFGVEERDDRRPVSPRHEDRHYRGPIPSETHRPSTWTSSERTERGRDRRYSTSSSRTTQTKPLSSSKPYRSTIQTLGTPIKVPLNLSAIPSQSTLGFKPFTIHSLPITKPRLAFSHALTGAWVCACSRGAIIPS